MSRGIILITIGILGIILNTIGLIVFIIKMQKVNERAFIIYRGIREPRTVYITNEKTEELDSNVQQIYNIDDTENNIEFSECDIEDTVLLE